MVIDGKEVPFNRNGDYLSVKPTILPDTPSFDVELKYHGRIYYISDISGVNIISLRKTAALPSSFAFIPIIDKKLSFKCDRCKQYYIKYLSHKSNKQYL